MLIDIWRHTFAPALRSLADAPRSLVCATVHSWAGYRYALMPTIDTIYHVCRVCDPDAYSAEQHHILRENGLER